MMITGRKARYAVNSRHRSGSLTRKSAPYEPV
jgi:hypothetical protein